VEFERILQGVTLPDCRTLPRRGRLPRASDAIFEGA